MTRHPPTKARNLVVPGLRRALIRSDGLSQSTGMVGPMLLAHVVTTSQALAATRSRREKVSLLAACLEAMPPDEVLVGASYLAGHPRQPRLDVGWRTLGALDTLPASDPRLTLHDVDLALEGLAGARGSGSRQARIDALTALLQRATESEQRFLQGLVLGELRQGALEGILLQAIGAAFAVPEVQVRRAAMLRGDVAAVAQAAACGGVDALAAIRLEPGRPVQPMLASTAPTVAAAVEGWTSCAVEAKLDGARIQVHRVGDDVRVWSRSLKELTARLPEVVALARELPASTLVLDGEVLALDLTDRPRPFAETMQALGDEVLAPFFFDCLHHDGADLIDEPLRARRRALEAVVPAAHLVTHRVVTDADAAAEAMAASMAAGQEGVVVKALDAPYEAGRRGSGWRKVKPVHSLDLVVLAAEWGSGRRRGWLSNLHLGARGADGQFVMLGKTFKGLTDQLLGWQTDALLAREISRDAHVVHVRPELVVEIAVDGVQTSTRYPGGVTLRFARVKGYRPDKTAEQADTITMVRALRSSR